MNFKSQYSSQISRRITTASFFISFFIGLVFFEQSGMIALFVFIITTISISAGEEILMLFAGNDLKLELQIGKIGISYLKLAINIFRSKRDITEKDFDKIEKYMSSEFGKEIGLASQNFIKNNKFNEYSIKRICNELHYLKHTHKLQFIHQLFALVYTDKEFKINEEKIIFKVSVCLNINIQHYENIKAIFLKSEKKQSKQHENSFYSSGNKYKKQISFFSSIAMAYMELGVSSNISNANLKTTYRNLVKKYHPDKYASISTNVQKQAKEKFQKINNAYNLIKKIRNL